jgi:hypothetical protein
VGFAAGREALSCTRATIGLDGGNVLKRNTGPGPSEGKAELTYLDGDFRIVKPGAFVTCAVTGVPIPLEELKYWSVDLQEAYATPEAVLQRHPGKRA